MCGGEKTKRKKKKKKHMDIIKFGKIIYIKKKEKKIAIKKCYHNIFTINFK